MENVLLVVHEKVTVAFEIWSVLLLPTHQEEAGEVLRREVEVEAALPFLAEEEERRLQEGVDMTAAKEALPG
jgi:hypothetical protein